MPVKLLGWLSAGFPSPASDYMENSIDLNKAFILRPSSTFFFRVDGESMIGAFIPPKALLLVDKAEKIRNGAIVVAVVDGEYTVKRFIISGTTRMLVPEDPKFQPIELNEFTECEVWGVVTFIISDAKTV